MCRVFIFLVVVGSRSKMLNLLRGALTSFIEIYVLALGLLLVVSTCSYASQVQQSDKAESESMLSLQQLRQMTDSSAGLLEIKRPAGLDGVSGKGSFETLSLDEVRRRAVEESYTLGASHSKVKNATNLELASYSGILPSLDLRIARSHETTTPSLRLDDVTGEPLSTSTQTRKDVYAIVSQPLFDPAAVADIRNAIAIKRASVANEDGVRSDVNYESAVAFFGAVEAALVLKFSIAQQKRLEKLEAKVVARANAGGASGADRDRIQARVQAAKSSVQDAIAQSNQANIALSRLIGSVPYSLKLPALADVRPVGSLEKALSLVSTGNSTVLIARENEEASRQERRKYQSNFLPVVKFELSTNKVSNSGGLEGWRNNQQAAVVMTMPLFSGGADYFKQRASLAKQEQYEYERMDAEREAQRNLQIAFSGLASAREKIISLRQQAKIQARVVAAFDAQLASTTRNLLDVFDAYQEYHQSQLELVHTSAQAVLLEQQILKVTGQLAITL